MKCFNCYSIHADQYSSSISKQVYQLGNILSSNNNIEMTNNNNLLSCGIAWQKRYINFSFTADDWKSVDRCDSEVLIFLEKFAILASKEVK
jgi:hypothetical protein